MIPHLGRAGSFSRFGAPIPNVFIGNFRFLEFFTTHQTRYAVHVDSERLEMINTDIIHPQLLQGLAEAGHGANILVADANYPVTTKVSAQARIIHLNFVPGMVGGIDIVRALEKTVPIESAAYMAGADGKMAAVVAEYKRILGDDVPFDKLDRFAFYDAASRDETSLVIASGEQRVYANLLITVGVR